jgi:hypothetical protein
MPTPASAITGRRIALLIATSDYTDPTLQRLRAPGRDARELAGVLRDPQIGGFGVQTLINASSGEIQERIQEFCADCNPDDQLLIYLSCHGVLDDSGRLYYAAKNTRHRREAATAVAASWLNERLEDSRARRQIILLDCCHSGAFARGSKGEPELDLQQRFRPHGRGRVVLTASRGTEYSFEGNHVSGDDVRSVFTHAIVEGLRSGDADRDKDGLITVIDLYHHLFEKVRSAEPRQTPELWTYASEGDLLVARSIRGPVIEASPLPEDLRGMLDSPRLKVREAGVSELAELLDTGDPGLALSARAALQRIAEEDLPRVAAIARTALNAERGTASAHVGQELAERSRKEERARRQAIQKAGRLKEQQQRAAEKAKREEKEKARRQADLTSGATPDSRPNRQAGARARFTGRLAQDWRARRGLPLLITIPALAIALAGTIGIVSFSRTALADGRVGQLANLSADIISLSQKLEDERDQTAYFIGLGKQGGRAQALGSGQGGRTGAEPQLAVVQQQYGATDPSVKIVRDQLNQVNGSFSGQAQQEAATARTALADLQFLRTAATQTALPALVAVQKYTQMINDLLAVIDVTAQGASDAALAQTIRVLGLVSRMQEQASEQRGILVAGLLQHQLDANQMAALTAAQSEQLSNLQSFNTSASVGQRQLWDNSVSASYVFEANAEETQAISTEQQSGTLANDLTSADDWYGAMSNQIDSQMGPVEQNLESQITSHVSALHARALILAWTVGLLIVLLALLFSVILRPSIHQLSVKVRPVRQSDARHRGAVERGDQRSRLSRELEDLGSEHHEGAPHRAGGPST